jgi:predicted nucleic acid-binding protein
MKIFLDANILVSVLNKEFPLFSFSSRIISLGPNTRFQLYTSPLCLAIAFYFAEKKCKTVLAKQKINLLANNLNIAANSAASVKLALQNPSVYDFEDGLEYYAAEENGCACIITEDVEDFYFSEIEVLNCRDFFRKYMDKQV